MPVLPAAGGAEYTGTPRVEPAYVPTEGFNIRVSPEQFGEQIGRATSQLGQTLAEGANQLAGAAIQRQDLFNQIASDNATNQYLERETKLLYGDPNDPTKPGFMGLKGQDALRGFNSTWQSMLDLRNQIRSGLQNDRQRLQFDSETRRQQAHTLGSMGWHYDQELKTAAIATDTATQTNERFNQNNAALGGDDAAFEASIERSLASRIKLLDSQGATTEQYEAARHEIFESAVITKTEALATVDPEKAMTFLENHQDLVADKNHYNTLYNSLQPKVDAAKAAAAVDRAMGRAPPAPAVPAGKPLEAYTPSTDILKGTGLTTAQYDTFRHYLASREAGSYAQPPNAGGYMGQYQMGKQEIADTAARLGVPVPSQQEFLSNPQLQEKFFDNYTLDHHNQLMQESETYRNASPQERAAILAGAHLGGVKGVQNYLERGVDPADANGTRISNYVGSMRRAMGGTTTPPVRPAAATGGAPAASLEVWGDSLGQGLNARLKTTGYSHGGDSPETIFGKIKEKPEDYWNGKTIVLSSGSNRNQSGADQMQTVEDTIKYLKDRGANVIAVGYGTNESNNYPQRNAQLREIGGRLGVPVVAAEDIGSDGVHPSGGGYESMAGKIRGLMPAAATAPATPEEQPKVISDEPPKPKEEQPARTDQPILTRGTGVLAAAPTYIEAQDKILHDPSLSPKQRADAMRQLNSEYGDQIRLQHDVDAAAHQTLTDWQAKNEAELYSKAINGQPIDRNQMSWMVQNQFITPGGERAIEAELARKGKGTDDADVFNGLDRRARAGEDITADLNTAVENGSITGRTALTLLRAADARTQKRADEVEKSNFATLRTVAGMDAQNQPIFTFEKAEDKAAQIALWAQAQQEWTRRVELGGEDSSTVLRDMAPRYTNTPQALGRIIGRQPKFGTVSKLEDIPDIAAKTKAAHDSGQLSDDQYQAEQGVLVQYQRGLEAQKQRDDAIGTIPKPVTGPTPQGATQGRTTMQ